MNRLEKEPSDGLGEFADKLQELAMEARAEGISTLIVCTGYDPFNGTNMVSVRSVGNWFELYGAIQGIDGNLDTEND